MAEVNGDGTFNIDYDDGDKERDVPADFVRRRAGPVGYGPVVWDMECALALGDKVEARYMGEADFFAGQIAACNDDGTFNIQYDDGDQEFDVNRIMIRKRA